MQRAPELLFSTHMSNVSTAAAEPAAAMPGLFTPSAANQPARPLSRLDEARYRARHHAMAVALGAYVGVLHRLVRPLGKPSQADIEALRAHFQALLDADLANVAAGHYPRDLLFDMPYRQLLRALPGAILDQPKILRRARARRYDDLPAEIDVSVYPRYYRRAFHWQTDGWLSHRSAALYDISVELLFGGTGDVMRRMALPALLAALRGRPGARALDVACGTGRFLSMLRRAAPEVRYFGVDLSGFYIDHARQQLGPDVHLSVQNGESLSFQDGSFDAISVVFLLHELPSDVRRRVVREAGRLLRPGGRLVICDARQEREADGLLAILENFPALYHEPYFKGYLRDDLESVVADAGLRVESSSSHYLVKVVVARG